MRIGSDLFAQWALFKVLSWVFVFLMEIWSERGELCTPYVRFSNCIGTFEEMIIHLTVSVLYVERDRKFSLCCR